ncbi:DUF4224 domain-containing protein [Massilia sp. TS11]|uniref:DUF4224 domain-containing protein n=1 Tax=Massilia sp. TS11 TaxID=2908003 RepID=UPI001EDA3FAD|nr:DUF4224 domain-containing protein [Massilia sp. TS11]MCG2585976.1 DUF4224 domain-containing protein [Massilia sp. TS11]
MNGYLSADELAALIGCKPNSYACMRRYLKSRNWPFEPNLRGFPCISRDYYNRRLAGELSIGRSPDLDGEPDFSMFQP